MTKQQLIDKIWDLREQGVPSIYETKTELRNTPKAVLEQELQNCIDYIDRAEESRLLDADDQLERHGISVY